MLLGAFAGGALIGGGYLFHLWRPAPFLVAAGIGSPACAVPILLVTEDGGHGRAFAGVRTYAAQSWRVRRTNRERQPLLAAQPAWYGAVTASST